MAKSDVARGDIRQILRAFAALRLVVVVVAVRDSSLLLVASLAAVRVALGRSSGSLEVAYS